MPSKKGGGVPPPPSSEFDADADRIGRFVIRHLVVDIGISGIVVIGRRIVAEDIGATDIDAAYSRSLSDAALTEALTKAGVTSPALLKAAKALHGSGLQVVEVDGVRTVKAGDKALGDFITEWAGTDEGKHFVAASDSNGGGSGGSRGNPNSGDTLPALDDRAGRAEAFNKRLAATSE